MNIFGDLSEVPLLKTSYKTAFLIFVLTVELLTACSEQGPSTDEAYRVGYDIGIADECGKDGVRTEPMPSAYDDSLGDGELESAFQSGYWTARSESQPCKF